MTRKNYESPEVEIEKFTMLTQITCSDGLTDDGTHEDNDGDFDF